MPSSLASAVQAVRPTARFLRLVLGREGRGWALAGKARDWWGMPRAGAAGLERGREAASVSMRVTGRRVERCILLI